MSASRSSATSTREGRPRESRLDRSVSVVIPSVRGGERLIAAVDRLRREGESVEVVVADNGLHERTVAALRSARVDVLSMGGNRGFGAAVNRGARAASGEFLVVMNDDAVPQEGFLGNLVAPLEGGADMVAGVLIRDERRDLIESAGIEIDAALSPYDYLHNEPVARLDEPPPPPFGPCGGAAAYRRAAFLEVGGFDEGFFAYGEDVDLAIRFRAAGGHSALAPRARAFHAGSGTLGYDSLAKAVLVAESRGYLIRKYGVLKRPRSFVRVVAVEAATSLVLARRHGSLEPAAARVRGWRRCRLRASPPPRADVTVGLTEGLRRRYARSNRMRQARGERRR